MHDTLNRLSDFAAVVLGRIPMVAAFAVLLAGILVSERTAVGGAAVGEAAFGGAAADVAAVGVTVLLCVCVIALSLAAVLLRGRPASLAAAFAAVFMLPFAARSLHRDGPLPEGRRLLFEAVVDEPPSVRGGWVHAAGRIVSWADVCGGQDVRRRVRILADTVPHLSAGDRISCLGSLAPLPDNFYGRLMRRRGFTHTLLTGRGGIVGVHHGRTTLHAAAVKRLSRLNLPPDEAAVAAAMVTGERGALPSWLRRCYSRGGTSHILAVSGLHVGIVFLLANLLSRWMSLLRHGTFLRCLFVVAAVWCYASVCGMMPSVRRAAVMFSMLQAARLTAARTRMLNLLAGAAFVLAAVEPEAVYDISFMLSFSAVAGIMVFADIVGPVQEAVASSSESVGRLFSLACAGFASFAATAPLVSCFFGSISPVSVLLTPVVAVCAAVTVAAGGLWLLLPAGFMAPALSAVLSLVLSFQNGLVCAVSSWPWSCIEVRLAPAAVAVLYLAAALAAVWRECRRENVKQCKQV